MFLARICPIWNPSNVYWTTLNTNISLRRMASVLKSPSQMLGLELGWEGLSPVGIRGGRVWRSCLRGSEGGWERGGAAVGKGFVGWGILSGGPKKKNVTLNLEILQISKEKKWFLHAILLATLKSFCMKYENTLWHAIITTASNTFLWTLSITVLFAWTITLKVE